MDSPPEKVLVRIPEDAWDILAETLTLDTQSYSFDPSLRDLIKEALKAVRQVERKKVRRTWVLSLLIPEGAWSVLEETLVMDIRSKRTARDLQKQLLKAFVKLEVTDISPKDWSPLWQS